MFWPIAFVIATTEPPVSEALAATEAPKTLRAAFTLEVTSGEALRVIRFDPRLSGPAMWQVTDSHGRDGDLDAVLEGWAGDTSMDGLLFPDNLPERLGAEYIDEAGEKVRPVMLHRAILGSMERFLGILIEEFAGAFPMWLAPTQVVVATITSDADDYALEAAETLRAAGLRVETDLRNEKINYKVREHSVQKVPVIAVVGRNEAEERKLALRRFGSKAQSVQALEAVAEELRTEATPPDLSRGS